MTTWKLDPAHSEAGFWVRHLMVTKVRGQFRDWSAQVTLDGEDLTTAKVSAEVKTASIDTRDEKRDAHLRSADFFEADTHPTMTFQSSKVEKVSDGKLTLHGALTMHGVTRDVVFDVTSLGKAKDPWGGQRWAFDATTTINRKDFGLNWNQALETGGVLVSEDVTLELQAQLVAG